VNGCRNCEEDLDLKNSAALEKEFES
jgi:hypothetical protein